MKFNIYMNVSLLRNNLLQIFAMVFYKKNHSPNLLFLKSVLLLSKAITKYWIVDDMIWSDLNWPTRIRLFKMNWFGLKKKNNFEKLHNSDNNLVFYLSHSTLMIIQQACLIWKNVWVYYDKLKSSYLGLFFWNSECKKLRNENMMMVLKVLF